MANFVNLKGKINDLQITSGHEDFAFSDRAKETIGTTAGLAAVMGAALNSSVLLSSSGGANIPIEYYTCTINGNRIAGKFHKTEFANGDEIEFVCEERNGIFVAFAARCESKRLIWTLPYQEKGWLAYKKQSLKWCIVWSFIFSAAINILFFFNLSEIDDLQNALLLFFFMAFSICMIVFLFVRSYFLKFSKEATPILAALGFSPAEWADLSKTNKLAQNKIYKETGLRAPLTDPWVYRF